MPTRLPITAIVITCNESRHLRDCLESLGFCDELLVCDLGSTDDSVAIARRFGARSIARQRVPVAELLWPELFGLAKHDWVLQLDPDEIFAEELIEPLDRIVRNSVNNIAAVSFPKLYYFFGKPLSVSIWGGTRLFKQMYRRDRIDFTGHVHQGIKLRHSTTVIDLSRYAQFPIRHYWVDSLAQMIEKHRRYIWKEGEDRYARGERFSHRRLASDCVASLKTNLFTTRAITGGWRGLFLTGFHAWYVAACHLSLRRNERTQRNLRQSSPIV
jgi:glycosyltransferase involved in cell wall biosynthesis